MHQDYISVVGGVGWLAQYRLDAAVYIGALQRASHSPTIGHVINLNRLLKWLRRKSGKTVYSYIPPPYRITCVSDSAFKATDKSHLACRGHLILLTHQDTTQPGGACHVLDAISRRQRRVNRSTFGAELNGLDDALESAKLAAMMYAEAHHGKKTTKEMKTMLENGTFPYRIEATIDAYSVFAALISKDNQKS
jgi:hypothetical protein